jgi:hypothetical protein
MSPSRDAVAYFETDQGRFHPVGDTLPALFDKQFFLTTRKAIAKVVPIAQKHAGRRIDNELRGYFSMPVSTKSIGQQKQERLVGLNRADAVLIYKATAVL